MNFQTIDGVVTAEKVIKRLINENAINLASCYARLKIVSDDFTKKSADYTGPMRDLVVSVVYGAYENLLVLGQLGARDVVDAVRFNAMDAAEYHFALLTEIGNAIEADSGVELLNESYGALVQRLRPDKQAQAEADELDEADRKAAAANDASPPSSNTEQTLSPEVQEYIGASDAPAETDHGVS